MNQTNNIIKFQSTAERIKSNFDLRNHLQELNSYSKVKLRAKKTSAGRYSFYLELNQNGSQDKQFLNLYYDGKSNTRRADKDALLIAKSKQVKANDEYLKKEYDYKLTQGGKKTEFIQFYEQHMAGRGQADHKNWQNALNYLKKFIAKKSIYMSQVDRKFCKNFASYLKSNLSNNTAHTYFAKIKAALNIAIKNDILLTNPAQFIIIPKQQSKRDFLTAEEIKKLIDTPCSRDQLKRAFLFSCFTGFRISDIKKLTWGEIQGDFISITQEKTKEFQRLKLAATAMNILKLQKSDNILNGGKVFKLIHEATALKYLKAWAHKAGINKNVSWHVGRHSFATLSLTQGAPIYTVSKLLGHRSVKVTEVYAKIIDLEKDRAIDALPEFDLGDSGAD